MVDNQPELGNILAKMAALGASEAFAKVLSENDNTKNQVYFGPNFEVLHLLPHGDLVTDGVGDRTRYKAELNLQWLNNELRPCRAPESKLILYPQYPEVRFSGFLRGCDGAPAKHMRPRSVGYTIPRRILMLAVNHAKGEIYAYLAVDKGRLYRELEEQLPHCERRGVFHEITRMLPIRVRDSRDELLVKLLQVHRKGWIVSKRLDRDGNTLACLAPNCGGLTLEAELDIRPNSRSEPDYLGWEVKQHSVISFEGLRERLSNRGAAITLMTPEPRGGVYVEQGVERFVRRYGYADRTGRKDRLNFGGKHVFGVPCNLTGLTLLTMGFDHKKGTMRGDGSIALVREGEKEVAAEWPFSDLLTHWSRKHAKAAYVPSMVLKTPRLKYRYANIVRLGEGTDFLRFLKAVHAGVVFYDPGIKLENASGQSKVKRRSQFRILSGDLACLYGSMTTSGL